MSLASQTNPMADRIKLIVAALIVIAGFVGFYLFSNQLLIARLGILLAAIVVGLAVAWTTETGKRFYAYCQDAIVETKKVVWPSRKETLQTTGVVVAFVVIMALFLWIVDASLAYVVNLLVRREG